MASNNDWVSWFRHASPYIKKHQNTTMVLALSGDVLASERLENLSHDIALLNSLGVKLVLVLGGRPQINSILEQNGIESKFHRGLRVTEAQMMNHIVSAYGCIRTQLEAQLSMGVINSPMHGVNIKVVSGNLVMAKPVGVLEGVDYGATGQFRRLDKDALESYLENRSIALIPALGYSVTGEVFNLEYGDVAARVAAEIGAEKLIIFGQAPENNISSEHVDSTVLRQLSVDQAKQILDEQCSKADNAEEQLDEQHYQLNVAVNACQLGVERVHLVNYMDDDAFLRELFTRDGSGMMISKDAYDEIRPAELDDVNGILELIRPLESQGVLIRRSRERLESELDLFWVNVRDNAVVACVALYPLDQQIAELSCFAVDESYRRSGRGDRLLEMVTHKASERGFEKLVVLTTQTEHWFKERGFVASGSEVLPESKRYNQDRNSKVLLKQLNMSH